MAEPIILAQNKDALSSEAKAAIILACEESIMQTANILKNIEELEKHINPPNLQGITAYTGPISLLPEVPSLVTKLKPVEATHIDQKMQASQIGEEVEKYLKSYNMIVSKSGRVVGYAYVACAFFVVWWYKQL